MTTQKQRLVPLVQVPVEGDLAGVEMGILPNGQAFLSASGVATLCGLARSTVIEAAQEVVNGATTPRAERLRRRLERAGVDPNKPYQVWVVGGRIVHAYSDAAVIAFVAYWAHDANSPAARAAEVIELLAIQQLRDRVYEALGRSPASSKSGSGYYARLVLNPVPSGYWSILNESAAFVLRAEQAGFAIDPHNVPEISVGQAWGRLWQQLLLDQRFGARRHHPHAYPDGYPQAVANSSMEAWIYPDAALEEFRRWRDDDYLPKQFPRYLEGKVTKGQLSSADAEVLIAALAPLRLKSTA